MTPTPRTSEQHRRDPAEDAPPPAPDQDQGQDQEAGRESEAGPPAGASTETEREHRAAGSGKSGFSTWRGRLAGAVAAMLFAATATTAVLQWTAADRLAQEKADRAAVSTRAGEFAVALQTYDHTDLQAYRDRVFAISGEDFEKTYNEAFSPLEGVITTMRASSSASIRGVYVSAVGEGRAKAITVVDSQVTSTAGTRRMLGTYMELSLIKTGGRWKVNAATVMGAAEELVTDPNGETVEPSPTSSPAPSPTKKGK
ncbi:hypothetical protein [Streptosporangium sp. NPDC001681]|uniref:hypothetical protein n=1 Tax=Streptosporangium sp. NPDC001681 TaxID=3154395 RepID=UPI003324F629